MHRYNESVLHKWTNNAERELYLNGNNHDLNDSRLFDYNEELNNAVEGELTKKDLKSDWCTNNFGRIMD